MVGTHIERMYRSRTEAGRVLLKGSLLYRENKGSHELGLGYICRRWCFDKSMSPWKMSNGFVFAAAGWLLSVLSIVGTVGYITGLASGSSETPDFVLFELWVCSLPVRPCHSMVRDCFIDGLSSSSLGLVS
jgi:hypothetical protein